VTSSGEQVPNKMARTGSLPATNAIAVKAQRVDLQSDVSVEDPRALELPMVGAHLECLASGATWAEGPVWMHEDASLLFSDIPGNRMMRWSARDGFSTWRDQVGFTNGHFREVDGSLLHCSHGQRAIVRTRFGGRGLAGAYGETSSRDCRDEVVISHYQGKRLNSPNDLVVKSDGTIWFTDPPYGILSDREGQKADIEQAANYVFRFDPRALGAEKLNDEGQVNALSAVTSWLEHPNGLAFSPDESILYVTDTSAATGTKWRPGNHQIVAFDVVNGATLVNPRVFAVIYPGLPDGLRVDSRGWVFTSSLDSVQVFHPDGTRLARIPVPEKVGNLTFGGPANDELFITASRSLFRIRLRAKGVQNSMAQRLNVPETSGSGVDGRRL
jgi:gluconolactonase